MDMYTTCTDCDRSPLSIAGRGVEEDGEDDEEQDRHDPHELGLAQVAAEKAVHLQGVESN